MNGNLQQGLQQKSGGGDGSNNNSNQQQEQQQQQYGSPLSERAAASPQKQDEIEFKERLYVNPNTGSIVCKVILHSASDPNKKVERVQKSIPIVQGSTLHERELEHFNVCQQQHCRCPNLLRYDQCAIVKNQEKLSGSSSADSLLEILMEYANRGSLDNALAQTDPSLRCTVAKAASRQIIFGLSYYWKIHNRVTRDLKPSNLFGFDDGRVAVGDFDVSRTLGPKKKTGSNNNCIIVGNIASENNVSSAVSSAAATAAAASSGDDVAPQPAVTGLPKRRPGLQKIKQQQKESSNNNGSSDGDGDGDVVSMTCAGTNSYMSPELRKGEKYYDPAVSDCWSFAASVLSFFSNEREHDARSPFHSIIPKQDDVAKLPHFDNVHDPALKFLLQRCLIVDSKKRMNLMNALAVTYVVQNPKEDQTESETSSASSNKESSAVWENCFFHEKSSPKVQKYRDYVASDVCKIKLCDETLQKCVCSPTDSDVDEKIEKATEALEEELESWRLARVSFIQKGDSRTVKSKIDYAMFKIIKERCQKSYVVMEHLFSSKSKS